MRRIATAALLLPPAGYVILFGPEWLLWLVISAVALANFYEYAGIVAAQGIENPGLLGYAAGLMLLFVRQWEWLFAVAMVLGVLVVAMRFADLAKSLPYAGALTVGVIYIFGAWRCGGELRAASPHWLFFALVLNWLGDTAAYYVGSRFGRHKLAPAVSPRKTVEGALASVVAAVAFGVTYLHYFLPSVGVVDAVILSVAANLAGQLGDLAESALKRGAGIKDSGNSLPGHGGWLDRLDSSLFAMPVVYIYVLRPWSALALW